jgi:hypothetical protein
MASNRRKAGLLRELGLERARVRSMESVGVVSKLVRVTPSPILPGSGGANHTGLVGKGIDSNR